MNAQPFLIEARGVTKSFGPTSVLKGVDFAVRAGEVHALLGGNGAGKSTLIKIITGTEHRDSGELLDEGAPLDGHANAALRSRLIAVVHQELALLPHLSVAENIVLPRCGRGLSVFSAAAAATAAVEALSLIDREFAARAVGQLVRDLTLHERQLVEIARTLASGARLLLLDEPTANLTAQESERLFTVIRTLTRDRGIGVVFVSHRMREIRLIADVCTIIRNGRAAVQRAPIDSLSDSAIVEKMGQARVLPSSPGTETVRAHRPSDPKRMLRLRSAALSLEIEAGSIVGLAGAPVGPSELIDQMVGVRATGRWTLDKAGWPGAFRSPLQAARIGVGYVSGDRANKGVLASLPLVDNLMASHRVVRNQWLVPASEVKQSRELLQGLSIQAASLWDLPATLSGGTQQKVLFARWTGLTPEVLVLEEPTRGVDVGTKREIYAQIRHLADQGTTVIWWSTESGELMEVCKLVLAFDPDGEPTCVLRGAEITDENLAQATGMAA